MAKDIDRCHPCAVSAGIQMYYKVLRKIAPAEAKTLYKKFENSRLSVKKFFAEAKKIARDYGTATDLKKLKAIDKMIQDEG